MGPTKARHVKRWAGNLLKVARLEAGVSQQQLGEAAHVAQSTIARIEVGERQPSLPELAKILAGVDLELRISLAPYDDHDDVLDADQSRLSPGERTAQRATQVAFVAAVRARLRGDVEDASSAVPTADARDEM